LARIEGGERGLDRDLHLPGASTQSMRSATSGPMASAAERA
jgi:hypothetical protein